MGHVLDAFMSQYAIYTWLKVIGLRKNTNGHNSIRVLALEISAILGLAYELHSDVGYTARHPLVTSVGLLFPHGNIKVSFIWWIVSHKCKNGCIDVQVFRS